MTLIVEPARGAGRGQGRRDEAATAPVVIEPVQVAGKFFRAGCAKWYVKGLTYGPFAPNSAGLQLPAEAQIARDFEQIRRLGGNCLRLYHVPPRWLLDLAGEHGLRVFVDVPWEKHRCFFEDWSSQQAARAAVREAAHRLRDHPALFALSVVNEIPADVVRFYGSGRIAKFIDELIDSVKQISPASLATFANYPSTEFLEASRPDFMCFNVYLEDSARLASYMNRLQHLAGAKPLVLGEFGVDSIRKGEPLQSQLLREHVDQVFAHGLAGSFVFAFTDDWYTGGHQIEDWAFGITRTDRTEKPAAQALREIWRTVPRPQSPTLPRVSVVVCSYNGAATLAECLSSLAKLNYPEFEIILVDDGSTDETPGIAANFPFIRYIRQENKGLSVARNVGAEAATGEIVAYTDSDCVADPEWLHYLVEGMQRQRVDAIGGPNVPPASDSWTAKCVAASPGGPSHVMFDDCLAEHVPGCNMAFRRETLLGLGGFDPQFRQAGDDVDMCWRLLDAGHAIGYAPSALVWHHRRSTIRAYLKQQKGYGRSEAMLINKHPQRFNTLGSSLWKGIIYGEGAVGLPTRVPIVHHGRYGFGLFQRVYATNEYSTWAYFTLLEWHTLALLIMMAGALAPQLLAISGVMWLATIAAVMRSSMSSTLPPNAPWWARPAVVFLHFAQPIVRSWHRYVGRLSSRRLPAMHAAEERPMRLRRISLTQYDAYWTSNDNRGREHLLEAIEQETRSMGWNGRFHEEFQRWDMLLYGGRWCDITLCTVTEELGWPRRFTRARVELKLSRLSKLLAAAILILSLAAGASLNLLALGALAAAAMLLGASILGGVRRGLNRAQALLWRAGRRADLAAVGVEAASTPIAQHPVTPSDHDAPLELDGAEPLGT